MPAGNQCPRLRGRIRGRYHCLNFNQRSLNFMSTEKTKRVKMNYKVSEFHHLFFNKALPENAAAGEHAFYRDGVLYHDRAGVAAAAFLKDARGANGEDVAVLMPDYHGGRWLVQALFIAIPEGVPCVKLAFWPASASGFASAIERDNLLAKDGDFLRCQTAAGISRVYIEALKKACSRAAHSALDAAGNPPVCSIHCVQAVRDMLALDWNDKGQREAIRAELESVIDYYQLGSDGAYDKKIVAAIAQRDYIAKDAAAALVEVRKAFDEIEKHKNDKTPAGKKRYLAAMAGNNGRLSNSLAAIARAGLPAAMLAGLPDNIAGFLIEGEKKYARASAILQAPIDLRNVWIGGHSRNSEAALLPARWKARYAEAQAHLRRQGIRAHSLEVIRCGLKAVENLREAAEKTADTLANIAAGTLGDFELVEADKALPTAHYVRDYWPAEIEQAANICNFKDKRLMVPVEIDTAELARRVDEIHGLANEARNRSKWVDQKTVLVDNVESLRTRSITRPRDAAAALAFFMRDTVNGYSWRNAPQWLKDEAETITDALHVEIEKRADEISALQEFENGGQSPDTGDWLRINGREAVSTRGAVVPVRALRAAFAFIDNQPEGAFDCRAANFNIGAYQLRGRDDLGRVIVGCHTFSAAAVQYAREKMQQAAEAAA
jgi:hypothetical protein